MLLICMMLSTGICAEPWAWERVTIKKEFKYVAGSSYLFLNLPESYTVNSWVICKYYNYEGDPIATTRNLLHRKGEGWPVEAKTFKIKFILCTQFK